MKCDTVPKPTLFHQLNTRKKKGDRAAYAADLPTSTFVTHPQHALTHTHGADYVLRSARSGSGFWAGSICLVQNGTGCPHTRTGGGLSCREGGLWGARFAYQDHVATWVKTFPTLYPRVKFYTHVHTRE